MLIKKMNVVIVCLLLFAFSTTTVAAVESDPYHDKVMDSGELVVGLSAGYAPYEFHATVNGKDTIVGLSLIHI